VTILSDAIEAEIRRISSQACPAGGNHDIGVAKTEEYPDGTIKYILTCRKCMNHFELEV